MPSARVPSSQGSAESEGGKEIEMAVGVSKHIKTEVILGHDITPVSKIPQGGHEGRNLRD